MNFFDLLRASVLPVPPATSSMEPSSTPSPGPTTTGAVAPTTGSSTGAKARKKASTPPPKTVLPVQKSEELDFDSIHKVGRPCGATHGKSGKGWGPVTCVPCKTTNSVVTP